MKEKVLEVGGDVQVCSSCLGKRKREWTRWVSVIPDSIILLVPAIKILEKSMELVNQGLSLPSDTLSHGRCSHGISRVGYNWDGGENEEMREGQGSGTCVQGSDMTDHRILAGKRGMKT